MPRTLVCFRRAAAGRACGEHKTIHEKALTRARDGTVRPRRPTMKAMLPRARSAPRRDGNVVRKKIDPVRRRTPREHQPTRRLPGLSETNYKVLAGVTALGVAAPALLFVSNVVLPEVTKAKAPAKKPAAGAKAPASTKADAKFALPTLPKSKSKSTVDATAKKEAAAKAKAKAAAARKEAAARRGVLGHAIAAASSRCLIRAGEGQG